VCARCRREEAGGGDTGWTPRKGLYPKKIPRGAVLGVWPFPLQHREPEDLVKFVCDTVCLAAL
jgi:hypothetical protein